MVTAVVSNGVTYSGTNAAALNVNSGGTISGATLNIGGVVSVRSGGTITATTVNSGAIVNLQGGANLLGGMTWNVGSVEQIGAGFTLDATNQSAGINGLTQIMSLGTVSGLTVGSTGQLTVSAGGTATSTTISSGGILKLIGGAVTTNLFWTSGAIERVGLGYIESNFVSNVAYQVLSGGLATSATVSAGGLLTVSSSGSATSIAVNSGGTLVVKTGAIVNGLNLAAAGANIDLSDIAFTSGDYVEISGGTLYVKHLGGAVAWSTTVSGVGTDATFNVVQDSVTGTLITMAICYRRGTRILTPAGEVAIETLQIGDRVVTRFGGLQTIRWIGRQQFTLEDVRANAALRSVCIHAGALGEQLPARDLYVSPGHSMLVDGTLVLAKSLVNGLSITQVAEPAAEDYFNLELAAHDCVLAEGTWSETYADVDNLRQQFHNAAEYTALYPQSRAPDALSLCAARPESGAVLDAALRPVVARAGQGVAPGPLKGWVETVAGDWKICGWAQDTAQTELPVLLEVLLGGKVLGSVLACDYRPDLAAAGLGRGHCGFVFISPRRLTAEVRAELQVRRASDGALLPMNKMVTAGNLQLVSLAAG